MDANSNISIYNLITQLCHTFAITNLDVIKGKKRLEKISDKLTQLTIKSEIKRLRSLCYELLLSKKVAPIKQVKNQLENNNDPLCHLLAWQFVLIQDHEELVYANNLQKCLDKIQTKRLLNCEAFKNAVQLLIQLRQVPADVEEDIMERTVNRNCMMKLQRPNDLIFNNFNENSFKLPSSCLSSDVKFDNNSFFLKGYQQNLKTNKEFINFDKASPTSCSSTPICVPHVVSCKGERIFLNPAYKDEGYKSPTKNDQVDIWEVAAHLPISNHRTWETMGNSCTKKENPFLCESGSQSSIWVQNVCSVFDNYSLPPDQNMAMKLNTTAQDLVKDLKYLLVGMRSNSFTNNGSGGFFMTPGIATKGISSKALESYCSRFIFCGGCYKALINLCTPNAQTGKYQHQGYIFSEFCESIKRYLSYYRVAALAASDGINLLALHEYVRPLLKHIGILASICKVGPFAETVDIPKGVELLNYLYQKIMTITDKNLIMVLYSVLYPCCQVYISRFLQQWIFEGIFNDPYDEFFVTPNLKYISTRGRTYWTRGYTLRNAILPEFVEDLKNNILTCGRAMNLLKLCLPNSLLCIYLIGKKPTLINCCLTSDQLQELERNCSAFYLEAVINCNLKFSMTKFLEQCYRKNQDFLSLIATKRAATLLRIELQRKKYAMEVNKKKQLQAQMLKEQYDEALKQKELVTTEKMEHEMKVAAANYNIEELKNKLLEEEAKELLLYYNKLCDASEKQRNNIEKQIKKLRAAYLDIPVSKSEESLQEDNAVEHIRSDTSTATYHSTVNNLDDIEDLNLTENVDLINANLEEEIKSVIVDNLTEETNYICDEQVKFCEHINSAAENFEVARKNKDKVMNLKLGFSIEPTKTKPINVNENYPNLTDAQKNKLKIMSSEFSVEMNRNFLQANRLKVLSTNECFVYKSKPCDNENFMNKNVIVNDNNNENENNVERNKNIQGNRTEGLVLNLKVSENAKQAEYVGFKNYLQSPNFELEKPSPMSIDSTPLSELTQLDTPTDKLYLSIERAQFDCLQSSPSVITGATDFTEDGFCFQEKRPETLSYIDNNENTFIVPKQPTAPNPDDILTNCLNLFLKQSISIPLVMQTKLINTELLKYFMIDLKYLQHLESLRNYFFLFDGEFGRNVTDGLFEKLYDADFPIDLINVRTLKMLVSKALDSSSKYQKNSERLSFKINSLPRRFDLRDPDVFSCISLTYKISWPLNVLLPSDTVVKYDEVFKFLLKLNRVSWVLQQIFLDLKILMKQTTIDEQVVLMISPQFRRMHQCRHVMMHFIQTLQNYIVGEVLQTSWKQFKNNLKNVTDLDQLYSLHAMYIKNILFMCLLNQKAVPVHKVIQGIFTIILKFYDYLRSRLWGNEDGIYTHPNFKKLENIFNNFEEFVIYLFKAGRKMAKVGYQPHLVQLLDMLDVNGYYSKLNVNGSSANISS